MPTGKSHWITAVSFTVITVGFVFVLGSCGGGGSGGSSVSAQSASQPTGTVQGYVYARAGFARISGGTSGRAAQAAPDGYEPLSGATVSCNGKTTTSNANGYYVLTGISVGTQSITIAKTGYRNMEIPVTVIVNNTVTATEDGTMSGVLIATSETGSITVLLAPELWSPTIVYLDNVQVGTHTPITLYDVPVGKHTIRVHTADFGTSNETVPVLFNKTTTVSVSPMSFEMTSNGNGGVHATVYPSTATTFDTITLKCGVDFGGVDTILANCNDNESSAWQRVSIGDTVTCTYSSQGTYYPACQLESSSNYAYAPVTITKGFF